MTNKCILCERSSRARSVHNWWLWCWEGCTEKHLARNSTVVVYLSLPAVLGTWLWDTNHGIAKQDHQPIIQTVKRLLYFEATEMLFCETRSHPPRICCIGWWYIPKQCKCCCIQRISTTFRSENTPVLSWPGILLSLLNTPHPSGNWQGGGWHCRRLTSTSIIILARKMQMQTLHPAVHFPSRAAKLTNAMCLG